MSHILAQQNISLLMVFDVLVTFTLYAGVILYYSTLTTQKCVNK